MIDSKRVPVTDVIFVIILVSISLVPVLSFFVVEIKVLFESLIAGTSG